MAFFDSIKRRITKTPPQDGLTATEAPIALEVAQICGYFMRGQYQIAAVYSLGDPDRDNKKVAWPALAFGFGALEYALQCKGIPWTKLPYVSVRFAEVFMPENEDHKQLAQLICHFGADPAYEKYRVAGGKAFSRVMDSDESTDPPYPDDFARLMGFRGPNKKPY